MQFKVGGKLPPAVHLSPQLKKIKQKRGRITHRVKNTYSIFLYAALSVLFFCDTKVRADGAILFIIVVDIHLFHSIDSYAVVLRFCQIGVCNIGIYTYGHGFIRRAITITNGPDPAIHCNNIIVSVDIQLRNFKLRRQAFQLLLPISVKAIMRITLNEKVAIATVFVGITKRRLQIVCGHQLRFDLLRCQK